MTRELIPLLEWTHQELLARLSQISPQEWVCHIHARSDSAGASYLESTFSTLFIQLDHAWKGSVSRNRYDCTPIPDGFTPLHETFALKVERLNPPGGPFSVLEGDAARRAFFILRDFTRQLMINEAISTELSFDDPIPASLISAGPPGPSYEDLLSAIDNLPPNQWRITFVQHGGPVDFCQRRLSAEIDTLRVALGENLLPKVDAPVAAAAGIPRFLLEVRDPNGSPLPHRLTPKEVEHLYQTSQERISQASGKKRA